MGIKQTFLRTGINETNNLRISEIKRRNFCGSYTSAYIILKELCQFYAVYSIIIHSRKRDELLSVSATTHQIKTKLSVLLKVKSVADQYNLQSICKHRNEQYLLWFYTLCTFMLRTYKFYSPQYENKQKGYHKQTAQRGGWWNIPVKIWMPL